MSTKAQVEWRRAKVLELLSMGNSQTEIAKVLQIGLSIVCRDVSYLRTEAKQNIKRYIVERLPEEYEKCLVGLTSILREAWGMSQANDNGIEKIKALTLAKECYAMKLELLTNATVVDDAIRFVSSRVVPTTIEKANSDDRVTVDEEISNSDDIQGSEENRSHEQQSTTTTRTVATNNSIF